MARVTEIHGDIKYIDGVSFYVRQGRLFAKRKSSLSKSTTMSKASLMNIQKSRDALSYVSSYHKRLRVLMNGFMNVVSLPIRHNEFQRKCYALVDAYITREGTDKTLVLRDYGGYLDGFSLGTVGFNATNLRPTVVTNVEGGQSLVWALDTLSSPLALPHYVHAKFYRLVLFGFVIPGHNFSAVSSAYGEVLGHVFSDYMAIDDTQHTSLDALRFDIKQPLKATDSVVAIVGLCYYTEKQGDKYSELYGVRAFSLLVL